MGAGAAVFIWAVIILQVAFPMIVASAYVAIARPEVDRKWLFWIAGAGIVLALRTITQAVAGLLLLKVLALREHVALVTACEMALAAGLAVPTLGALARGFGRRSA